MKRLTIALIVIGVMLFALPATAKKPPNPTPAAPVAVSLDGSPMWVHEADDVIRYSVTVQNKARSVVAVEVFYGAEMESITIQPKSTETVENLFSRTLVQSEIGDCVADADECNVFAEVTVRYAAGRDLITVAEASTLIDPVDKCIFKKDGEPVVTKSGLCIWKPPPGVWELSAVPYPVPMKPTNLMMTMRDGVPGNWCTLTAGGTGGAVRERWARSSTAIVLDVNLPSAGECLTGGHGVCTEPDCYFAVGNPKSFYLYTTFDGFITLTGPQA
jgi:hypothetical protein